MLPYLNDEFGNPGSRTHDYGRRAATAVAEARQAVASLVDATSDDVIFTSGATESNNLAIKGVCHSDVRPSHVITASTEHHAVLDVCKDLERQGWDVTYLPVDSSGRVTAKQLAGSLRPDTRLVSIMWANNETGVLNDIAGIATVCRSRGVLFHTDAVQALGRVSARVGEDGIDLLSMSAHKMYGPKGVGALVVRRGARRAMRPLLRGGGQERGLRAGTLPAHQVVGFGTAARLAHDALENGREAVRVAQLRDLLLACIRSEVPDAVVNGSMKHRLPGNLNVWIPGCDAEALAMRCRDVAFSTGSACTSESMEPSYVILAMTGDEKRASESVRFGVGRFTTEAEVRAAAAAVATHVADLRSLSIGGRGSRQGRPERSKEHHEDDNAKRLDRTL